MRRREFITALGGAAASGWAWAAQAQQPSIPVIGFLHLTSLEETREYLAAFHRGLRDMGFIEGKNVALEYRWGEGRNDRLAPLVQELVHQRVSVIAVIESTNGALAAKAATQTIPIVFMQGADPVRIGLVERLNRPGGNITGINLFLSEVAAKRLELLMQLTPSAKIIAYLRNPTNPVFAETETKQVESGARSLGVQMRYLNVSNQNGIEASFETLAKEGVGALFVSSDGYLLTHNHQIVALAGRYSVPASYGRRDAVTAGGLISYGADFFDAWRQAGVYAGRILKGEKPADLSVQQVTKVELLLNLATAKALGITVPPPLLGRADEVIE